MELQTKSQAITINETVLSTSVEQPIECDVLLPDYCPDIVRIMRCSVEPAITQATASGDKLTVEGVAVAHVYYKSTEREICHTEFKMPFTRVVELKTAVERPVVHAQVRPGYFNCRAVNQRRLDMRGCVTLCLKVLSQREEQVLTEARGLGVQAKQMLVDAGSIVASEGRCFTLREDAELGTDKIPVLTVIRSSAAPTVTDQKIVADKVILKGELQVDMLYIGDCEGRTPQTAQFTLPFSQIVDANGVDENCDCSVQVQLAGLEVQPKPDLDGQATIMAVEAVLCVNVAACRCSAHPVAVDSYCTRFEMTAGHKTLTFAKMLSPLQERIPIKEQLELPAGVASILDLWVELETFDSRGDGDGIVMEGKLAVCMFARTHDGEVEFFDRSIEFSRPLVLHSGCDWVDTQMCAQIVSSGYGLTNSGIDLTAELLASGLVLCSQKRQVLTGITVDPQKPLVRDNRSCLAIYFADRGESVWDIAKRYNTSPELILEENEIEGDILTDRCMLLIPVL